MTSFNDFETVLAAANEELNNLKAKSKEIQEEIDTIDQDRYQTVYNYFDNLLKIMKRNNICSNSLYVPTPMTTEYGSYYVIRISQGWEEKTIHTYHDTKIYYPELGIHFTEYPNQYYDFSTSSDSQYNWRRWMGLKPTYTEALIGAQDKYSSFRHSVEDFFLDLVEHFEEYEPTISANFKEAVTREMAHNIKKAEVDVRSKVATLVNK